MRTVNVAGEFKETMIPLPQRDTVGPTNDRRTSACSILVVEDDPDTLELICFSLVHAGFVVRAARNAAEALQKAETTPPALVVLDLILPDMDGLDICKIWRADRKSSQAPILILTARSSEMDRILGLELGASGYMTKPFSPRELVLRIHSLLPNKNEDVKENELLRCGDICIDVPRRLVRVGQRQVILTATEFRILSLLAQSKGKVQTRGRLQQEALQKAEQNESRTIDTHMQRLRQKLDPEHRLIKTIRGIGYRLLEEV
jgi:DNA-binding response OmpR family regulator